MQKMDVSKEHNSSDLSSDEDDTSSNDPLPYKKARYAGHIKKSHPDDNMLPKSEEFTSQEPEPVEQGPARRQSEGPLPLELVPRKIWLKEQLRMAMLDNKINMMLERRRNRIANADETHSDYDRLDNFYEYYSNNYSGNNSFVYDNTFEVLGHQNTPITLDCIELWSSRYRDSFRTYRTPNNE